VTRRKERISQFSSPLGEEDFMPGMLLSKKGRTKKGERSLQAGRRGSTVYYANPEYTSGRRRKRQYTSKMTRNGKGTERQVSLFDYR